jgi:hypothetical protein
LPLLIRDDLSIWGSAHPLADEATLTVIAAPHELTCVLHHNQIALGRYRRIYSKMLGEYTERPMYDHASHAADALLTFGIAHRAAR